MQGTMDKNHDEYCVLDLEKALKNGIENKKLGKKSINEIEDLKNIEEKKCVDINSIFSNYLFNNPDFIKNAASNENVVQEVLDREQKRLQKDQIINIVKWIIGSQLFFMGVIIVCVVAYVTINIDWFKQLDYQCLCVITDLLKYYVTATLAEVIGMLFFIVKHLFT